MIKYVVGFDGGNIYFENKLIEFVMSAEFDYWLVEGSLKGFETLEEAVQHCLEV